jgi:hypothetical protein
MKKYLFGFQFYRDNEWEIGARCMIFCSKVSCEYSYKLWTKYCLVDNYKRDYGVKF